MSDRPKFWGGASLALTLVCAASCGEPQEGAPEPWPHGLAAGLEEIERLSMGEQHSEAIAIAARMVEPDAYARFRARLDRWSKGRLERVLRPITGALDWIGIDALSGDDLGEVEFARGLALMRQGIELTEQEAREATLESALAAFTRARAAGADVRADAVCALGLIDLQGGEAVRATLPEISGAAPQPTAPGAEEQEGPDPLEVARALYLEAKDHFVEGLGLEGARDPQRRELVAGVTRAGVELCIRRLRELDEIEQQREEQQQDQQQQDQQQDQQQQDQQQDQDGEGEPDGDPQDQEDPGEAPPEDEQQEGEQSEDQEQADSEEQESETSEDEAAAEQEIEEREMTKEELERFLQQARENQEEGEERRRTLLQRRKVPTQRDW